MRQCVDDVKAEITKKRNDNKSVYCKPTFNQITCLIVARGIKGHQEF